MYLHSIKALFSDVKMLQRRRSLVRGASSAMDFVKDAIAELLEVWKKMAIVTER